MAKAKQKTIKIQQVRSGIGFDKTQKATLKALGLGRLGRTREMPDNPQVRGMVAKVSHLVQVLDEAEGATR